MSRISDSEKAILVNLYMLQAEDKDSAIPISELVRKLYPSDAEKKMSLVSHNISSLISKDFLIKINLSNRNAVFLSEKARSLIGSIVVKSLDEKRKKILSQTSM